MTLWPSGGGFGLAENDGGGVGIGWVFLLSVVYEGRRCEILVLQFPAIFLWLVAFLAMLVVVVIGSGFGR